jgi:DNA-binding transcriptional LysR family regulator
MELRHLRYFVAIAELGSFTRAAQSLSIAQPPLSKQIRDLEAEIGSPLLVRHVRGVTLTATGERVLEDARDILARADRLRRHAAAPEGPRVLGIGFIPSVSDFFLPRLLPRLRRRFPALVVELREMLTLEQLTALQRGSIAAALCRPPIRAKTLRVAAELADPFCLAIPPGHKLAARGDIALQAAAAAEFVAFKRDQARAFFDQTLDFCTEAGFNPVVRCEAGTVFGVMKLVAAGVGVAIVPASAASAAAPGITFRRLVRPARTGALMLVVRKVDRDPAVGALVAAAKTGFAELAALIRARLAGT